MAVLFQFYFIFHSDESKKGKSQEIVATIKRPKKANFYCKHWFFSSSIIVFLSWLHFVLWFYVEIVFPKGIKGHGCNSSVLFNFVKLKKNTWNEKYKVQFILNDHCYFLFPLLYIFYILNKTHLLCLYVFLKESLLHSIKQNKKLFKRWAVHWKVKNLLESVQIGWELIFFPLCSVNWVKWFEAKIEENRKNTIIDPRNEGVRNVRTLKVDVKTTWPNMKLVQKYIFCLRREFWKKILRPRIWEKGEEKIVNQAKSTLN